MTIDDRTAMRRLGLLLPSGSTSSGAIADRAREAEATGFDSAWASEDSYSWECFASLGYVAAVTDRIALGVGVTTPYIRAAALLASAAATLDRFANGRFMLGIGRSGDPVLQQIGIDDRVPLAVLREATEGLRLL
ncbi:MAG: LLM class flavin-dependent oxidoreductase [Thermomicrobiales bacterium]|nr:LLM class flavin-dependent oxidoreductase [Thermomicrobiales bacterium]